MASRGDLQKQLVQIMGVANAQGLKFEDIVSEEVQVHFQDMIKLKEARAYIEDIEVREKELQQANADLREQLQAKEAEIDDKPADLQTLMVELEQSKNRIAYYQKLAENEQIRAERCQCRMEDALKVEAQADAKARKIQDLEQSLAACETRTLNLMEKNRALTDRYDAQREKYRKDLREKDDEIYNLKGRINQLEEESRQTVEDSEQLEASYDELITNIEQDSLTAAEMINSKSIALVVEQRSNDQIYSAIASELAPLGRFYDHAFRALSIYQSVLQDKSSQCSRTVTSIPQSLSAELDSASDYLYAYQHLVADLRTQYLAEKGGPAQEAVVRQVDLMANVAARMYTSLDTLREDISGVLIQVRKNSMLPPATVYRADTSLSGASTPTQCTASSRSSISSFASFNKRFSKGTG